MLLNAGIAPADALRRLATMQGGAYARRLGQAAADCARGHTLTDALCSAGLFPLRWQARLALAERLGELPAMLERWSRASAQRKARRRQLALRCLAGWGVMLIAVVAAHALGLLRDGAPLPATLHGALPQLALAALLTTGLLVLMSLDAMQWARCIRRGRLDRWIGPCERHATLMWVEWLMTALQRGLPADEAVESLRALHPDTRWQSEVAQWQSRVATGHALRQGLQDIGWPVPTALRASLVSGEHAGALGESLAHWHRLTTEAQNDWQATLDTWLPRLHHLLITAIALRVL